MDKICIQLIIIIHMLHLPYPHTRMILLWTNFYSCVYIYICVCICFLFWIQIVHIVCTFVHDWSTSFFVISSIWNGNWTGISDCNKRNNQDGFFFFGGPCNNWKRAQCIATMRLCAIDYINKNIHIWLYWLLVTNYRTTICAAVISICWILSDQKQLKTLCKHFTLRMR